MYRPFECGNVTEIRQRLCAFVVSDEFRKFVAETMEIAALTRVCMSVFACQRIEEFCADNCVNYWKRIG